MIDSQESKELRAQARENARRENEAERLLRNRGLGDDTPAWELILGLALIFGPVVGGTCYLVTRDSCKTEQASSESGHSSYSAPASPSVAPAPRPAPALNSPVNKPPARGNGKGEMKRKYRESLAQEKKKRMQEELNRATDEAMGACYYSPPRKGYERYCKRLERKMARIEAWLKRH